MNKNGFIFFILIILAHSVKAEISLSNNFINYDKNNGYKNEWVEVICQDKHGFIWFGTKDGLVKFDGYSFETFRNKKDDSTSLISNEVVDIIIDGDNNMIIATNNGLSRFNSELGRFEKISFTNHKEYPSTYMNDICKGLNDELFAVKNGIVWKFSKEKQSFEPYTKTQWVNQILINQKSDNMFVDDDGNVWVAGYGITYCDTIKSVKNQKVTKAINDIYEIARQVDFIKRKDSNSVFIGTYKGLFIIDWSEKGDAVLQYFYKDFALFDLFKYKNVAYIATRQGLIVHNLTTNEHKVFIANNENKNSLASTSLRSVFKDKHENLWVGTIDKGICLQTKKTKKFNVIEFDPEPEIGVSNNMILSLLFDKEEKLWIGFENAIGRYNIENSSIRYYKLEQNKDSKFVVNPMDLEVFNDKAYASGWGSGIMIFDINSGKTQRLTFDKDVDHNYNFIRNVFVDSKENFWFAATGMGLQKLNLSDKTYAGYKQNLNNIENSLANDAVTKIYEDRNGKLWIGTFGGLSLFNQETEEFTNYFPSEDPNSLINAWVFALLESSDSLMYIGTAMGLSVLNPRTNTFENYTEDEGLGRNFIFGILEDDNKNIWLGTRNGISMFNPQTKVFKNFTHDDGLHGDYIEFSASAKAKDGTLYFGGPGGITSFKPENIQENPDTPQVVLTDLFINYKVEIPESEESILSKSISLTNQIELNHKQSIINIHFVAVNYVNPSKNMYSYKLEGFDNTFTKPDFKREATYTNLNPGTYTFVVKASNNDGLWNETGTALEIVVLPPWWRTYWAFGGYFILISLLVYLGYIILLSRYKMQSQIEMTKLKVTESEELARIKAQFFTNISHELRTPLTLLISPIENIIKQGSKFTYENNEELFSIMHNNADRLLRLVNQLLDFRKIEMNKLYFEPKYGNIVNTILEIYNAYIFSANQQKINFQLQSNIKKLWVNYDKDKLEKILNNLLSNAFKYTNENDDIALITELNTSDENTSSVQLIIKVTDTGTGISNKNLPHIFERFYMVKSDSSILGSGIGLALTKDLVEMHNGTIHVNSKEGEGTTFTVTLNLSTLKQVVTNTENYNNEISIANSSEEEQQNNKLNSGLKQRILIVDDTQDIRKYLKFELGEKYVIDEAINGEDGLRKVFKKLPDIILSDVMMPKMNGIEMCKRIKSDQQISHIPVILITARHSEEVQLEGFDYGADEYIKKPFNIDILKSRIAYHLSVRENLKQKYIKNNFIAPEEIATNSSDEKFLKTLYEIVFEKLEDTNFNTHILCKEIGMSKTALYEKIKALTGSSTAEFIKSARMNKASALLQNKELNITDVAYKVGFNSSQQFYNTFSKFFGMSPTEYRNAKKNS